MKGAYYNEYDANAAAWLRELIRQGHIAPGDVDERSIEDVHPDDLKGYAQCHFFAGIGVWSYALRRAGWADDRHVWTGSCPCQPFSAAGKGAGFADERHLWPAFHYLIRECAPAIVLGEQVASKDGLGWFDLVSADMEGSGYACGAVDLCAAGVGAPHIRQRLWWVAERMADAAGSGHQPRAGDGGVCSADAGPRAASEQRGAVCASGLAPAGGPTNGFWRDVEWLFCRDGKWRPTRPIHVRMVDGSTARLESVRAGQAAEKEKVNAVLQGLRGNYRAKAVQQRCSGESVHDAQASLLQSSVYGGGDAEGPLSKPESQPHESVAVDESCLRNVWDGSSAAACASSGRGLGEQLALELDDVVRLLSPSRSLSELHGDRRTQDGLQALCRAIREAGTLCNASDSTETVWESLGEEAKGRLRVGFDAAQWELVVPTPLAVGARSRVIRLRGYGNAIVAPAAQTFIESVMDVIC